MAGQIIFNQMNDGPTGHLNLTFINSSGTSLGTWGANILDDGNSLTDSREVFAQKTIPDG
jgi:hypothetical protein